LKNAANSSRQEDQGDRCRQRGPIRSPVHADKVLGTYSNGERLSSSLRTGRVSLRVVRGALAGEALSTNNRGATPSRWRLAPSIIKTSCPSRDEARLVASNFNVLAANPFEARMRISSQHTASTATSFTRCYWVSRATSRPCAARRLASKFSPPASFLYRGAIKDP
jgi:hypothetical protein